MLKQYFYPLIEIEALFLLLFLANRRTLLLWSVFLEGISYYELLPEILLWISLTCLFLWLLHRNSMLAKYLSAWMRNWPLLVFIGVAALSLIWTVYFEVSLYKVVVLMATSLVAAYVGVSLGLGKFLRILAWFGGIVSVLSFFLAVSAPEIGTSPGYPYEGAWRGIFVSRGRLGSFMAFANLVFLFQIASSLRNLRLLALNILLYVLTFALVFLTRSATAIILVIVLHLLFFTILAWLRWRSRLRVSHYVFLGILLILLLVGMIANLDFLLGRLDRNTTLTGRVPLWIHLLRDIVSQRPVFGFGFGAIWDHDSFRYRTQDVVGWTYPVVAADNGFLDILLNLGMVGFLAFLVVFGLAAVRALGYGIRQRAVAGFFPMFLIVYVLATNLSLSYFFELEFFAWFLLASALFITSSDSSPPLAG